MNVEGVEDEEDGPSTKQVTDLTRVTNPQVEEGESRYLATEVLQEDYSNLTKTSLLQL